MASLMSFFSSTGSTYSALPRSNTAAVTKAALRVLSQHWPGTLAFADLLNESLALVPAAPGGDQGSMRRGADPVLSPQTVLASDLLQCHIAGLVELHAAPAPYEASVGSRPDATDHAAP